jgi:hypothetical protein
VYMCVCVCVCVFVSVSVSVLCVCVYVCVCLTVSTWAYYVAYETRIYSNAVKSRMGGFVHVKFV